jgi:uncharacterized membrane protein
MTNKSIREVKDTPGRSIAKAITWRIIASGTTFLITFVIFRRFTDQNIDEVLENASYVTAIEVVAKIIFYYLHERMWTNITWGKFMERQYWKERAWRKLYRQMHNHND